MGNKLKNKKLIHKLTWYTLERDDVKQDLEKYDLEFQKEFLKELEFLQYKKNQEKVIEGKHADIEQEPEEIENSLENWTNSLCWMWASKKEELDTEEMNNPNATIRERRKKKELNDELKKNVRQLLNIDEKEFKEFLNQIQ
jgi:hypothetical protein